MSATEAKAYSGTARALHWITAAFVLSMIPAGIAMGQIKGGPLQNFLFDYHRSTGVVLFLITAVRLAYRLKNPPMPLDDTIAVWQKGLAHGVHFLLYALLLVNPIVGWVGTSAYPAKITVFWLVELPAIVGKNRPLSETLLEIHAYLGLAAAALVCLHLAGVFYHQIIRKDGVLMRMVTG